MLTCLFICPSFLPSRKPHSPSSWVMWTLYHLLPLITTYSVKLWSHTVGDRDYECVSVCLPHPAIVNSSWIDAVGNSQVVTEESQRDQSLINSTLMNVHVHQRDVLQHTDTRRHTRVNGTSLHGWVCESSVDVPTQEQTHFKPLGKQQTFFLTVCFGDVSLQTPHKMQNEFSYTHNRAALEL